MVDCDEEGPRGEGDIEVTSSDLSWAISIPRVSCAAQLHLLWEASFNSSLGGTSPV